MIKKFILTCFVAFPLFAYAADLEEDGLTYTITDAATMTVKVVASSTDITSATIPSSVSISGSTYSVTSIGDSAFYKCTTLTSVTIPESVISIGRKAFSHCTGLTEIAIPESVTSIGKAAFDYSALTSITIPDNVTSIENDTFYFCQSLKSVVIGNSVTTIGGLAFSQCIKLSEVVIGCSVTYIDNQAFANFGSDSSVTTLTITVNTESAPTCSGTSAFGTSTTIGKIGNIVLNIPSTWDDSWSTDYGWRDLVNNSATINQFYAVFVTMSEANYATLYTEKAVAIPDDMTAYVAASKDDSSVTCTQITTGVIPAETGVLLNSDDERIFMFQETTESGETYTSILKGTLTELTPSEGDTYYTLGYPTTGDTSVLGFYQFAGTTIGANRAFLTDDTATAKGFSITFSDSDKTTGIVTVPLATKATNCAMYNLQGQRVSTPVRGGIYIQNRRKLIAK